jgi:hypothetical protein
MDVASVASLARPLHSSVSFDNKFCPRCFGLVTAPDKVMVKAATDMINSQAETVRKKLERIITMGSSIGTTGRCYYCKPIDHSLWNLDYSRSCSKASYIFPTALRTRIH